MGETQFFSSFFFEFFFLYMMQVSSEMPNPVSICCRLSMGSSGMTFGGRQLGFCNSSRMDSRCTKSHKGKTRFHLRCQSCGYDESVTSHTVFHKPKIPLLKAFGMTFRLAVKKKGMSTLWGSDRGSQWGMFAVLFWLRGDCDILFHVSAYYELDAGQFD